MTTNAIERHEQATIIVTPKHAAERIIQTYSDWATVLMKAVEDRKLYNTIGGKKHLRFEAWQLIAEFDHAGIDTNDVRDWTKDGKLIGYICHAKIIKDGNQIAGATMGCGLDAFPCRGKEGTDKDRAAMSAAQTWAGAKAGRVKYSSVASLAGYEVTPAEEMEAQAGPEEAAIEPSGGAAEHYCSIHKTEFFKRGKMKGYAHPIGDTNEWCNEPKAVEGKIVAKPEAIKPTEPAANGRDTELLNKLLIAKKKAGWSDSTLSDHIQKQFGDGKRWKDLTHEQQEETLKTIVDNAPRGKANNALSTNAEWEELVEADERHQPT